MARCQDGCQLQFNASADKQLATPGISSIDILCDNHEAARRSRGDEEGDEHDLEPEMSYADAHIASETVTSHF
jgi:hypothetical protein